MAKLILICIVILAGASTTNAEIPEWFVKLKQITPIVSTQADVEKIFGVADKTRIIEDSTRIFSSYDLEDGRLSVTYSNGKCKPNQTLGYDVAEKTVVTVFFTTKKRVKFSLLKVKLKGFYSRWESDVPIQIYTNYNEGIEYSISSKNVSSVKLFPAAKYNDIRCEKKS